MAAAADRVWDQRQAAPTAVATPPTTREQSQSQSANRLSMQILQIRLSVNTLLKMFKSYKIKTQLYILYLCVT
jgi:hypothetical protein